MITITIIMKGTPIPMTMVRVRPMLMHLG
jgi:hypothetical protein